MRGPLRIAAATALLSACSSDLEPTGAVALPSEAVAPAVSPEIEVGGTPARIPGDTRGPVQLTAGDGGYLAVWVSPTAPPDSDYELHVRAARVGFDGTVLEPAGEMIAVADQPAVAAGSEGFLVVMLDEQSRVRGARVGPDGAVLDPGGFPIGSEPTTTAAVAFDGTSYVVAWAQSSGIGYARVSPAGEVLGPPQLIPEGNASDDADWQGLACGGGRCLIAWDSGTSSTIRGARLDDQGALLDSAPLTIGPGNPPALASPSVAFDGASFVAAWSTAEGVLAARVSPGGVVLDPGGIHVGGSPYPNEIAVAFDGASTLVAWLEDWHEEGILVARLSPGGEVLDAEPTRIADPVDNVAIAGHRGNSFAAWSFFDASLAVSRLVGTRLSLAGAALDAPGIPLHAVASSQQLPERPRSISG